MESGREQEFGEQERVPYLFVTLEAKPELNQVKGKIRVSGLEVGEGRRRKEGGGGRERDLRHRSQMPGGTIKSFLSSSSDAWLRRCYVGDDTACDGIPFRRPKSGQKDREAGY